MYKHNIAPIVYILRLTTTNIVPIVYILRITNTNIDTIVRTSKPYYIVYNIRMIKINIDTTSSIDRINVDEHTRIHNDWGYKGKHIIW